MSSAPRTQAPPALNYAGVVAQQLRFNGGENVIAPSPAHSIALHLNDDVTLTQTRDGKTVKRRFVHGDLVVVPAGLDNVCSHFEPAEGFYIDLPTSTLDSAAQMLGYDPSRVSLITQYGHQDVIMQHIGATLMAEARNPGSAANIVVETALSHMAVHLINVYSSVPDISLTTRRTLPPADLARVMEYIQCHLYENLSLSDVASSIYMTPFHFSRLFKQATGFTPHQYILLERLKHARRLLLDTALPLDIIAAETGFVDASHLSRQFKRFTGVTPRQVSKILQRA